MGVVRRLCLILLISSLIAGCAAELQDSPSTADVRIDSVIERLASDDAAVRELAAQELESLAETGLSAQDCMALLDAAKRLQRNEGPDPSEILVGAAIMQRERIDWSTVLKDFEQYSENARLRIMRGLVEKGDVDAAKTLVTIAAAYSQNDSVPPTDFLPLLDSKEALKSALPALLEHAKANGFGYSIHLFALRAAEQHPDFARGFAPFAPGVIEVYQAARSRMKAVETATGDDWIWTETYADDRSHATLLLDLMAHLPLVVVEGHLNDAVQSLDPRVAHFAATSLMQHGKTPPPEAVERIAGSGEIRNWFIEACRKHGNASIIPDRFTTQEKIAESDMVGWLCYPTELARTPHEIELMQAFDSEDGAERFYLFRFRTHPPHWAAHKDWMAGLSGPFEIAEMPTTSAGGSTFSRFDKWDTKTPEEHFEAIAGLIAEHWKRRAEELSGE